MLFKDREKEDMKQDGVLDIPRSYEPANGSGVVLAAEPKPLQTLPAGAFVPPTEAEPEQPERRTIYRVEEW